MLALTFGAHESHHMALKVGFNKYLAHVYV